MTAIASLQGASIQCRCNAVTVCFRFSHRAGTNHSITVYVSGDYKIASSRPLVFIWGLDPCLSYGTDNQKDAERQVPSLGKSIPGPNTLTARTGQFSGPIRAFSAIFARTGPCFGPIRALWFRKKP